ncbi:putative colanic acid biosynthesis acetyltransferase [Altericista sp. CCNU0014]|uniref:putative colanic acid biosynthesis acetyltransferase n=1 Tax=Altericista sp. CCNU0014 TaxID=3082949 RepID=UPI0038515A51
MTNSKPTIDEDIARDLRAKTHPYTGPTFTLANRLSRLFWQSIQLLLFRFSPIPFHPWRVALLRLFGARIGDSCCIYPDVRIWAPWNLEMGNFSTLGPEANCYNIAPVKLGERVIVSQGVRLYTGSHDYESPTFQLVAQPIQIDDDAWICAEAFLLPNVTIGSGCIIGARSVVTRTQPAWTICAGNPCRSIKPRPQTKSQR